MNRMHSHLPDDDKCPWCEQALPTLKDLHASPTQTDKRLMLLLETADKLEAWAKDFAPRVPIAKTTWEKNDAANSAMREALLAAHFARHAARALVRAIEKEKLAEPLQFSARWALRWVREHGPTEFVEDREAEGAEKAVSLGWLSYELTGDSVVYSCTLEGGQVEMPPSNSGIR